MVDEKIKFIIDKIFGEPDKASNEFLYFCPRCNHRKKKLSINYNKNKFKCWVCDPLFSGSVAFLIKEYGNAEDLNQFLQLNNVVSFEALEKLLFSKINIFKKDIQINLPDEYKFLFKSSSKIAHSAYKYLLNRGLTDADIYQNKIGICESGSYRGRIIFPSFNQNGFCNFFTALDFQKEPKYKWLYSKIPKSHIIFNELDINWNEPVYMTEGNIDAYKISNNAIPLLGKAIPISDDGYSKLLESLWLYQPVIYLCLDTDFEKGKYINRSIKVAETLIKYGIKNIFIINPYPYKDFGEIPKEKIKSKLKYSTKIESKLDLMQYSLEMELARNA